MRILFLSTDFKPQGGGIAELSYRVCRELSERGHKVTVLTDRLSGTSGRETMDGFVVLRPQSPCLQSGRTRIERFAERCRWSLRAKRNIRDALRGLQPDVVFAGNYSETWNSVLPKCDKPYFVFLHGEDVASTLASGVPFRKRRMTRTLGGAEWTFWNSSYSLMLTARLTGCPIPNGTAVGCGYPVEKIVESVDKCAVRRELGWSDAPVLLTVSRVIFRKGIDTTIKALPAVMKEFPRCRYVILGDGPARERLRELAEGLGLSAHVEFLGFVSEEIKRNAYVASDLYVMPSRSGNRLEVEGFGISYLEANAHGLAVVGSTEGGVPDAVRHGENGLQVDPKDTSALAESICSLLRSPQRRQEMALAGQRRIRETYNWPAIVDQIEEKLTEAVRR